MMDHLDNNKKICFLHVGMARDGAERVIANIANHYAENGYFVDIIVLLLDECGYELHPNVKIVPFVRPEESRLKNIPYWIKNIRHHIKDSKPERVISFSMYVNIITLLACLGLKKNIIISERNDPSSDGRGALDRFLTRILYPLASKVVFQTKRAQNCFSRRIQRNSRIIGNPISVGCLAAEVKTNKIVTIGRLEPQKNHKMLLNAFAICHNSHPNLKLEIYGVGCLESELKNQCELLNISSSVTFMGSKPNVHEYIKDAKAFVLSSDFEGLSNALLEAMMMGLPCISTNCAGSDEVIENNYNGILVEVGSVNEMAAAINRVIENDDLSCKLGANAAQSISIYATETILKQWFEYIEA